MQCLRPLSYLAPNDISKNNQRPFCLESGHHRLYNADWTHVVLASGKLVPQNESSLVPFLHISKPVQFLALLSETNANDVPLAPAASLVWKLRVKGRQRKKFNLKINSFLFAQFFSFRRNVERRSLKSFEEKSICSDFLNQLFCFDLTYISFWSRFFGTVQKCSIPVVS